MKWTENSKLIEALSWRYAVKKFDATKKIAETDWNTLEQAMWLSASSFGLQPWKFLGIKSPEIRKKLRPVSWNQSQVEEASHFVVFAAKTSMDEAYVSQFIQTVAQVRAVPAETFSGYQKAINGFVSAVPKEQIIHWNSRQTYLALGNLLTSAAILGIDACPMEGMDPKQYDSILGLGVDYATVCGCALGYRSAEDKYSSTAKVRFPKTLVFDYR